MTLYETLGLDTNADRSQIKDAYSRLLSQYSRDAALGDGSAAKKISDIKYAKKTLLDHEARRNYDENLRRDLSENNTTAKVSLRKERSQPEIYPAATIPDPAAEPRPTDEELRLTDAAPVTMNAEKSSGTNGVYNKFPKDFIIKNLLTFSAVLVTVIVINICI